MLVRFKIGTKHVLAFGDDREGRDSAGIVCALVDSDARDGPSYLCAWAEAPREDVERLVAMLNHLLERTAPKTPT